MTTQNRMECDCSCIHVSKVSEAKNNLLDDDRLMFMADFYKAMSDSTRLKIINLLVKNELCVCDISYILNMTKSAISHQLKNLRELNLIKCRKQGKEVWYSLADEHVKELFDVCLEHTQEEFKEMRG